MGLPGKPHKALQLAQDIIAKKSAWHALLGTPAFTALKKGVWSRISYLGVCMDLQAAAQLDEVVDCVPQRLQQAPRAQRCSALQCLHLFKSSLAQGTGKQPSQKHRHRPAFPGMYKQMYSRWCMLAIQ